MWLTRGGLNIQVCAQFISLNEAVLHGNVCNLQVMCVIYMILQCSSHTDVDYLHLVHLLVGVCVFFLIGRILFLNVKAIGCCYVHI